MLVYHYMPSATVALSLSSETDKVAFLALKEKLTNRVSGSLPSWNESLFFCEWEGVTCSHRHMRVAVLNLENQYWGGILGPALGNLTFLKKLTLLNVNLQGKIPRQVGLLKRLQAIGGFLWRELYEATNGFSSSNLVGTGGFGSAYKGSLLHFEGPIAVKVLNLETHGASKSLVAEYKVLEKMKHGNLLKLLAFCSSADYNGEVFKALVFEFMPMGSLESLLHSNEQHEFTRLNIALDVAQALDYLHHNSEQVVVHCDIKPSNVLLDNDIVAYLGDFGLARFLHGATGHSNKDKVSSSAVKGTIGYVQPGLSLHKFCTRAISEEITEIVDACLLIPFSGERTGVMGDNNRESLVSFAGIGVACSVEFPAQRMDTKHVIAELHAIKQKLASY